MQIVNRGKEGQPMDRESGRPTPIHLKEEELIGRLPEKIGKVSLNYDFYPGEDFYSDGQIEDEILEIVKDHSRVEYPKIIEEKKSWPILYHLSPLRGNIVDWLPISETDKVLEIGSGCGAITEKLAEKAGKVTCVDLSAKRSQINAWRNQDRDQVEIYVGNFNDIEPVLDEDYDFACMIGVFEYGQSYIPTKTPYEDFLKIMQKHVKKGGLLVIAIENKFGLKYWAGCQEDHVGAYFCGLEGYPEGGSARTFTRTGLERIFDRCGVKDYHFYYPYPDYKLPTTIYSDRRLPIRGELTDNMRNFDRDRMVLFNEKYVFDGIITDEMFDIFSNSYMVVIGNRPKISYVKYSNDRAAEYTIKTEIVEDTEGKRVRKVPIGESAGEHVKRMAEAYRLLEERYAGSGLKINPCILKENGAYAEFPFEKGVTLEKLLDDCLEQNDMEGFYKLFDRYYSLISYGEGKAVSDYDLIFANILVDGEDWTLIDYEWTVEKVISSKEIAFRAVYCYVLEEEKRDKLNLDLLIEKIGITPQEAEEFREKERKFQKRVTGKGKSMGEIRAEIGTYSIAPQKLMAGELQRILHERIQLYFDRGEGFSEADSYYMPDVYIDDVTVKAQIPLDGNVRRIRIDPADLSCMVKIEEMELNGLPIPMQKRYVESNGKQVKPGSYVFATQDPNIEIKVSELPMSGENMLKVRMKVSSITSDMAEDIMGSIKKLF